MRYADAGLSFLAAAAIAAALTPLAARLARRLGAVDMPRERGLAWRETPLLGGLAILAAVVIAAAIWMPGSITLPRTAHAGGVVDRASTWGLLGGAGLIALVGAIDDVRDLPPIVKLIGQVAAAVLAVRAGAVVTGLTVPFLGPLQFPHAGGALTMIWLVALMNMVNFSDGVDGLAAGLCTIDGVAFSIIAFDLGIGGAAVLAALTAGAALGFLVHNFHPASVFMGDAGANLLGYLLGVASVVGSLKTNAVVALLVPLVILAIPFLDTGFVVAKRLKYRRKPWTADANHFHHRMARIGFSQRKTVAYLYGWSVLMAGLAVALRLIAHHHHHQPGWLAALVLLGLVCVAASVYLVYVLEIFKFKGLRAHDLRAAQPNVTEAEIDAAVARDVETDDFEKVRA
ncbi:MAG: undecaprenyl/decaprenyl-phosphate alpha-N-acetylglucosaminyl 1-phosphate transferase [Solirubrobacterales bacterium]|nr:undecaprenyl/decaprenyl-phosphate alpha-N-acetylglucosaminyl 1-phosphate transferase [Solirubrobacterales bacterium]